jgi:putative membrane protein
VIILVSLAVPMNKLELHNPQRQSILGIGVLFFSNLRKAFNFFLAFVFVNLGTSFRILGLGLEEWAYILSIVFLIISYFQYRKFTIYITGDNFVIEKGVLSQEKINVPFARIQTVNSTQNIIQRILGVVGLKIDTAGSVQNEIEIPALSKAHAKQLSEYLMERKYELKEEEQDHAEQGDETENSRSNLRLDSKPILELKFRELLLVGLTQNHFRSGFLLFAVINGYLWQFEDYLLKPFEAYLEETAESFLAQWILLLPFAILAFLIISVLASMIGTALTHFQFKFFLGQDGMSMSSGLLAKNTYNIPYEKIQYFKWESNPLRALIGLYTLRVKQAGTESLNDRKLIGIPGIKRRSLVEVLNRQYPLRKAHAYQSFSANRLLFIQLSLWIGILPVLTAIIVNIFVIKSILLYPLALLYLGVVLFFTFRYYQSYRIKANLDFIVIKKGWVFPSTVMIPNFKLQNIRIKQSVFQKRRSLASLQLYTAAGGEALIHIPYSEAFELYNYLLYCIESSNKKWM